jgi:hypothetical protein
MKKRGIVAMTLLIAVVALFVIGSSLYGNQAEIATYTVLADAPGGVVRYEIAIDFDELTLVLMEPSGEALLERGSVLLTNLSEIRAVLELVCPDNGCVEGVGEVIILDPLFSGIICEGTWGCIKCCADNPPCCSCCKEVDPGKGGYRDAPEM